MLETDKLAGAPWVLQVGEFESPVGDYVLAVAPQGICRLAFYDDAAQRDRLWQALAEDFPHAERHMSQQALQSIAAGIFGAKSESGSVPPVSIWMQGTAFQQQVWQALRQIPEGQLRSYQQVAQSIGKPRAVRAVASAVARNPIGYLIPCHRVIRSTGECGEYRWGRERKQALIGWEARRSQSGDSAGFTAGDESRINRQSR